LVIVIELRHALRVVVQFTVVVVVPMPVASIFDRLIFVIMPLVCDFDTRKVAEAGVFAVGAGHYGSVSSSVAVSSMGLLIDPVDEGSSGALPIVDSNV
jgi:hypothetical protein